MAGWWIRQNDHVTSLPPKGGHPEKTNETRVQRMALCRASKRSRPNSSVPRVTQAIIENTTVLLRLLEHVLHEDKAADLVRR